jgi:hypothetical protein
MTMKRSVKSRAAIVCVGAIAALGVSAGPFVGGASARSENAFNSCNSTAYGIGNAWLKSYDGTGNAADANGSSSWGVVCLL